MVLKTFVPSVHQNIEAGIEEIRIKSMESHQDSLLNFGIGFEMAIIQLLLQWSEEMKIDWHEVLGYRKSVSVPPIGNVAPYKSCVTRAVYIGRCLGFYFFELLNRCSASHLEVIPET